MSCCCYDCLWATYKINGFLFDVCIEKIIYSLPYVKKILKYAKNIGKKWWKKISSTCNLFQKLISLWSPSTSPSKHKSIIFFRYSLLGGEWNFHPFGINFWVTFRPYNSARCHVLHHEVHEIGILASSSDMWDRSQCFYVSRKSQWVLKNVGNSAVFSYDIYTFV